MEKEDLYFAICNYGISLGYTPDDFNSAEIIVQIEQLIKKQAEGNKNHV